MSYIYNISSNYNCLSFNKFPINIKTLLHLNHKPQFVDNLEYLRNIDHDAKDGLSKTSFIEMEYASEMYNFSYEKIFFNNYIGTKNHCQKKLLSK